MTGYSRKYVTHLPNGKIRFHVRKGRGKTCTDAVRRTPVSLWREAGCPCVPYLEARVPTAVMIKAREKEQLLALSARTLSRASWNRAFSQTCKSGSWKPTTHDSTASSLSGSPRRSRVASSACRKNTTEQKPGLIRISLVRRLHPRRFATPLQGRTAAVPPKPGRSRNRPRPRRNGVHNIGQTSNHPRFSLVHFLFDKLGWAFSSKAGGTLSRSPPPWGGGASGIYLDNSHFMSPGQKQTNTTV